MSSDPASLAAPSRRNPVVRLLSSIWLGIALLTLILIYSSIISALAPVRWTLEMTEMQAFRHWIFVTLVALFVLSLLTATFLRTRWIGLNAGALTAHLGLLLLIGGAVVYFHTKIEGDVYLQAPAILVRANMGGQTGIVGRFYAGTGNTSTRAIPGLGAPVTIRILETQSGGIQPIATAKLSVQIGESPARTLSLSDRPEDWQAVNESLSVSLAVLPPQTCFYDDETPVLYVRNLATGSEAAKRIEHLPIYRERYLTESGLLHDTRGNEIPSKRTRPDFRVLGLSIPTGWFEPWRMPIDVDSAGLPFAIRVTGYVPFVAGMQPGLGPDGQMRNEPILEERERRRQDVSPRSMSAIRLQLTGLGSAANWSRTEWCLFSSYPDVEERPIEVRVPGTSAPWEIIYSRARHELGATLAAERLWVTYFPGQRGVESYHSALVLQQGGAPPHPALVATNQTVSIGPWTLFQSGFDGQERWSYTILGVGNSRGMTAMNLGWIVVTLGCLFAFYVKPLLLRRVKEGAP